VVLSQTALPEPIEWAFDLRWDDDSSVLIAAGATGVVKIPVHNAAGGPQVVLPGGAASRAATRSGGVQSTIWLASRLALANDRLVAAAPIFTFSWKQRPEGRLHSAVHDVILDLDAQGDRLLILGALKEADGAFATDGAIAWIGKILAGAKGLRPVYFSIAGPGAKTVAKCGMLDLGGVRFLTDGSFLIVPGVESGIFWFSSEGKLLRTWESREVGLRSICTSLFGADELRSAINTDPDARAEWLNRHRILDEILALPQGPTLVLRETIEGVTRWQFKVLGRDGGVETLDVPLTSTSGQAHLKGDVRGNRLALLKVEFGREKPVAPPQLILAEIR